MPAATQVLRNSSESLRVAFAVDGTATNADGPVTVTIAKDSDGTDLVTDAATTNPTTGMYAYPLAAQPDLDQLTATWTGTFGGAIQSATTYVNIVGGYYVSLAELRAMRNLSDEAKFTTAKLIEARQWFESKFERYTGQAFVPRYKKQRVTGTGGATVLLDPNVRTVRSVRDYTDATTYTEYSAADLADIDIDPVGTLTRLSLGSWRAGTRNLVIVYEHGMDACPDDIREVAKDIISVKLLDDHTGPREYSVLTDVGIVRYSRPGPGRPFGNEEVDELANRYRMVPVS